MDFGDMQTEHRHILTEFIHLYRSEPCLWMVKAHEYRERATKERAYQRLSEKLREIDPYANRERVVKKINCLRTNYRKEKRKLEESRQSGTLYKPRLWYYHMFNFLDGDEDSGDADFTKDDNSQEGLDFDEEFADDTDSFHDPLECKTQPNATVITQEAKPTPKIFRKEQQQRQQQQQKHNIIQRSDSKRKYFPLASQHSTQPHENDDGGSDSDSYQATPNKKRLKRRRFSEDRYDLYGRYVATKLREVSDNRQKLFAEKLINETLFMAATDQLTISHLITSMVTTLHNDTINQDGAEEALLIEEDAHCEGTYDNRRISQQQVRNSSNLSIKHFD